MFSTALIQDRKSFSCEQSKIQVSKWPAFNISTGQLLWLLTPEQGRDPELDKKTTTAA
jgi:hypothetical protein